MAGDVVRNYKIRYGVEDRAAGPIKALGTVVELDRSEAGRDESPGQRSHGPLAWLGQSADLVAVSVKDLSAALGTLKNPSLDKLIQSLGRHRLQRRDGTGLGRRARPEAQRGGGLGRGCQPGPSGGAEAPKVGLWGLAERRTGRAGAGAGGRQGRRGRSRRRLDPGHRRRVEDDRRPGQGGDVLHRRAGRRDVGPSEARNPSSKASPTPPDATREDTEGWAQDALKLRDELRELANLKGKPGADDQVVKDQLGLRVQTGMTSPEARKFNEQFLGSLPLAKDAGGIDDQTAGQLAGQVGRLSTRVGLEGGTAGDLAGIMGLFGKVPDATVGLGRAQQVVNLLNDGRGNLTPLTKALVKGAASTVGEGKAFASLQERAAAISVASGIGDKGATDTTVGAAIRGLSPGGKVDHIATLERLGIGGNQPFMERLDRLKPLFDEAKAAGKSPQASCSTPVSATSRIGGH